MLAHYFWSSWPQKSLFKKDVNGDVCFDAIN